MYRVLVGSGGGSMGVQELSYLVELEKQTGKKAYELFDLICGTSTFGIIAAILACELMSAYDILYKFYLPKMKSLFQKNIGGAFWAPLYNRKQIDKEVDAIFGNIRLKDLKKGFVITAADVRTGETHFYKDGKEKYGNARVAELVKRTYSAPVYFGYVEDKNNPIEELQGKWCDGGTGVDNLPLDFAILEALHYRKQRNVRVMSVGCGNRYDEEKPMPLSPLGLVQAMTIFWMGRYQAEKRKVTMGYVLDALFEELKADIDFAYMHIDTPICKEWNHLDNVDDYQLRRIVSSAGADMTSRMFKVREFLGI